MSAWFDTLMQGLAPRWTLKRRALKRKVLRVTANEERPQPRWIETMPVRELTAHEVRENPRRVRFERQRWLERRLP